MTTKYNKKTVTVSLDHIVEALTQYLSKAPYSLDIDAIAHVKLEDDLYLDDFDNVKVTYFSGGPFSEG